MRPSPLFCPPTKALLARLKRCHRRGAGSCLLASTSQALAQVVEPACVELWLEASRRAHWGVVDTRGVRGKEVRPVRARFMGMIWLHIGFLTSAAIEP